MMRHRQAIEAHLFTRAMGLFDLEPTVTLFDLTNTFFEGAARRQPKAQRGHSKEKRSDCPLLTLGLVLDGAVSSLVEKLLPSARRRWKEIKGKLLSEVSDKLRTQVRLYCCSEERAPRNGALSSAYQLDSDLTAAGPSNRAAHVATLLRAAATPPLPYRLLTDVCFAP